ncbi:DUF3822 family protein [Winogradskyella sp. 3972H.M.0a.05]|uniref:DUF3822 family protein n=1 Tax=Winogradskyella sp. 3972H.M.0a.05 TaxID=2950277 RepID=UPI00339B5661
MTTTYIKELSIQVNLSGLSFCILNRTENTIEYLDSISFGSKLTPYKVLETLKEHLSTNTVFSDTFSSVNVIHHNELSTLVPKPLFKEENSADYLKFNSKILKTDFLSHDEIAINDSINVYVPYVNVNNYIYETFGEFIYKHTSTILIDTLLQKNENTQGKKVYINVNQGSFEILVIDDGKLLLYNSFDYSTKEDFIYFVLFNFEQLQLDPESVPVEVFGTISESDENFEILYKYVRHVSLIDQNMSYKTNEDIEQQDLDKHFYLLNSF